MPRPKTDKSIPAAPQPAAAGTVPNMELAQQIVTKLGDAGLIPAEKFDEIQQKIADGTASASDWGLWVHMALRPKKGGGHGTP